MYQLHSITTLLQESREMHTNHDIRSKWIEVILDMIADQLNHGALSPGVMLYLRTVRDVLLNVNTDRHTHTMVKTHLRIAEHFMEKAVMANEKRHDPLSMTWHAGNPEIKPPVVTTSENDGNGFASAEAGLDDIPF